MDKSKLMALLISKLREQGVNQAEADARVRDFLKTLNDSETELLASFSINDTRFDLITQTIMERPLPKPRVTSRSAVRTRAPKTEHITIEAPRSESAEPNEEDDVDLSNMLAGKRGTIRRDGMNISTGTVADVTPHASEQNQAAEVQPVRTSGQSPAQGRTGTPVQGQPQKQSAAQNQSDGQRASANAGTSQKAAEAASRRTSTEPSTASKMPQTAHSSVIRKNPSSGGRGESIKNKIRETAGAGIIHRPDPNADYRKFYIILACTSPLWIMVLLAVITLFIAAIAFMCAAIVFLLAGLVGVIGVGTVLAIVGIVYGITQIFTYAPIGMYEIGLGIMIGGITMLVGVVSYNIAIRLLPFLIKKTVKLLTFTMHKCIELYYYVKGECANL
ncbi:MAG: hypothetical protein LUH43_05240 [Clostridia bacterium]|nr:hypothetical protein [Clostridia bacterium]